MKINFSPSNIYFSSQACIEKTKNEQTKKQLKSTQYRTSLSKPEEKAKGVLPADLEAVKLKIRKAREERLFDKFLNKQGKVTIEEYKAIKETMPYILDKASEMVAKDSKCACLPIDIATLAINAKHYIENAKELDGKEYRIISIGTSPAPLTEAMQNLGCDVIYVPISGISSLISDKEILTSENLKLALEYLKSKGVCEEKNNNIKNIVIDYTFSGKTLSTICMLLVKNNKLKSKSDIWALSLTDLLVSVLYSKKIEPPIDLTFEEKAGLLKDYRDDLLFSFEGDIANVPHFNIDDRKNHHDFNSISSKWYSKKELFEQFEEFSKPLARAYSLCVIDEIMNLQNNL